MHLVGSWGSFLCGEDYDVISLVGSIALTKLIDAMDGARPSVGCFYHLTNLLASAPSTMCRGNR